MCVNLPANGMDLYLHVGGEERIECWRATKRMKLDKSAQLPLKSRKKNAKTRHLVLIALANGFDLSLAIYYPIREHGLSIFLPCRQ